MPNSDSSVTGVRRGVRWSGIRASVEYRRLRVRINALLADVGIPEPWEMNGFVERVATRRGRPVNLMPVEMPADGPDAMWVAAEHVDVILYDGKLKDLHWEQVIAHELSHILLAHRGDGEAALGRGPADPKLLELIAANVDTALAGAAPLYRDGYSDRQELEAELAASLIWKAAGRRMIVPARRLGGPDAVSIDKLQEVLGRVPRD